MAKTSAKKIKYQNTLKAAVKLRALGVAYSEILEKLGHWKSVQACQKAVATALGRDFDISVELARNEIIARNEQRIFKLMDKFEKSGSVIVSREITRIDDQTARLKGLNAPTKLAHEGKDGEEIKITTRVILPTIPDDE